MADSRDLTLGPLRFGGRDCGMPSGAGFTNVVLGSTDQTQIGPATSVLSLRTPGAPYHQATDRRGFDATGVPHYDATNVHGAEDRDQARRNLEATWGPCFAEFPRDPHALGASDQVATHLRAELASLEFTRALPNLAAVAGAFGTIGRAS